MVALLDQAGTVLAYFDTMADCWMQGIILLAIQDVTGLQCLIEI